MGWLVYYKRFRARTRSTSTRPADANTSTWSLSALLSTRPPTHNSSTPAVRELTAEQLMGTQPTTTNSGPPPAAANRRNRRPRRTPSQMSTTSLPAYNKEPGEQEVVVYRGTEDMEDNPIPPTTIVIPPVSEDGTEDSRAGPSGSSHDHHYPPHPDSPHDMPLLHGDESNDAQRTSHDNDTHNASASDGDRTQDTDPDAEHGDAQTSALAGSSPAQDPRGAAPAYEVADPSAAANGATISQSDPAAPPADTQQTTRNRRSIRGFRNLFQTRLGGGTQNPNAPPVPEEPAGHNRGLSVASAATSRSSASHARGHRPSGSLFSINAFHRTNSRLSTSESYNPEHGNASVISLNSIGLPLSHTVTRTSFVYPRSGMPTPEQVKLISSRESLGRFGVPFGDEAVRFASTSRVDLLAEAPPDFDESERAHSRQRSHSSAGIEEDIEEGDESQHIDGSHSRRPSVAYDGLPTESSSAPPALSPLATMVTREPTTESPVDIAAVAPTHEGTAESVPLSAVKESNEIPSPTRQEFAREDIPPPTPTKDEPIQADAPTTSTAPQATFTTEPRSASPLANTDFGPPPPLGPPNSTRGRKGPPSAFRPALLADPPRSESRASTMTAQTFQTANDGEDTDVYFSDFGDEEFGVSRGGTPTGTGTGGRGTPTGTGTGGRAASNGRGTPTGGRGTPTNGRHTPTGKRMSVASHRSGLGHALEGTDATIVPGRISAVGA
ncbi:hypothetical protein EV122DRAFT_273143 [Schizophyllum commune]